MKKFAAASVCVVGALTISASAIAESRHHGNSNSQKYKADPFVFIGSTNQCSPAPAGHRIVTAGWLRGMGLPDDGTSTIAAEKKSDDNEGLLLNKNGPTPDCSSAGAEIKPWKSGTKLSATAGLGFDYRIGTHCGAGAPRFNVTTTDGKLYFVGCTFGTHTPAPQDPEWERVVVTNPAEFFPGNTATPFSFDMPIKSLTIIYDEGTDTAGLNDPSGVGLVVLDNINISGTYITEGGGEVAH